MREGVDHEAIAIFDLVPLDEALGFIRVRVRVRVRVSV